MHPANELEISRALRSLVHDQAKQESSIQRGKEGARRFSGDGFVNVLFALFDEFQAIHRRWPAGPQCLPSV
jgi:hypothetical protein